MPTQPGAADVWNQPLLQTANFVVVPSLGALLEGWLLIVPKRHVISFGAVPIHLVAEVSDLKRAVFGIILRTYGSACIFEHGPAQRQRLTGCGVDHAHLHIVPTSLDLETAVSRYLPEDASWKNADLGTCRKATESGLDYIYLEQNIDHGRIVVHQQLGSQLIRRAIASDLGVSDQYNWREYPRLDRVEATILTVTAATASALKPRSAT